MNLKCKFLWCLPTFGNSLTCHSITLANFNLNVEQQQNVHYIPTDYFEFGITGSGHHHLLRIGALID